ncbi:MAG: thiamine pyrophosphate-binding protein [Spirochaetales bacterium]|nr:MAG: thiamine pyrophosphate-binding protein [Spirochaetales bacterium]
MSTVADQVVRRLKEMGVRHVYGVPSGSWLYYMEAMRKGGIEFVLVSNETSAGFMADVTYRLTGIPGVCYATVGPGATNLSTGVGGALLDRSAVIALTSEPPEAMIGRTVQMAIDQQALFKPLTKWTTRLTVDRIDQIIGQAFRTALTEVPGPVHIGLPEDLGPKSAPHGADWSGPPSVMTTASVRDVDLKLMEARFLKSRKPILAVGLSAVRAKVATLIAEIAIKHRIPVVLTPMAKGLLPEDHPWYAGVFFHALSDRVAETYSQADLVVGVGYDPIEFNYEEWMPTVPLLHLDSVPADIDRNAYGDVSDITGDIRTALRRIADMAPLQSGWDQKALANRKMAMFQLMEAPKGSFGARAALEELRKALPADGIMACDVGGHTHLIGQMWRTPGPGLQLMTNGWSSMGFGVPAAIAAKICRPDKQVACVTGDGGFLMMAGEMATARRQKLHIVFVILADRSLDLIRLKQDKKNMPSYGTKLYNEDFPSAEYVFGVPVIVATNVEEYHTVLAKAFEMDGPVIVEAKIQGGDYDELILRKHK